MSSNQEKTRKLILDKYLENKQRSKRIIAQETKTTFKTVYNVINTYEKGESVQRKRGSGRLPGPSNKILLKKVLQRYRTNPFTSTRNIAAQEGCSHSTVQSYKKYGGLKTYKQQKAPNRSEQQQQIAISHARKLYDQYLTKFDCVILDDETYVKADFKQIPGNVYYTVDDKNAASGQISTKQISKFAKQYMVWQAICSCGDRSEALVTTEKMNSTFYIEECLQKRLLPFIRKHKGSVLFWPDLATSHYASNTMKWYEEKKVNVVPKEANPPNCPELRPIERYWAQMKNTLRKSRKVCTNKDDFKNQWEEAYKVIDKRSVENLMRGLKQKVGKFCKRL